MLYSAAFSIAFYGLLRVSEVAVTGKTSDGVLMIENLYIDHNDLSLYIGVIFSKTDQTGREQLCILRVQVILHALT